MFIQKQPRYIFLLPFHLLKILMDLFYLLTVIASYNLKLLAYQTHHLHNSTDFSVTPKHLTPEGLHILIAAD